ncbi:NAD(P)-dependent oxidoreductase [Georgenia deserti]|uniref:NAD(P)-dependent oxidoreductase n=1 Tax=Georgenia deserti TaxID=2093781 RepID=A0ABW4L6D7_9MICO
MSGPEPGLEGDSMDTAGGDRVGFVGLGTMGTPMVTNVVRAGYAVVVHDADPDRTARIAAELAEVPGGGPATAATDPGDLAGCDVVVTMLPTSAIVRSVLLDGTELRLPLRPGAVVVDMSSSDPTETVETGQVLARHGVALVDAPVSGAKERAAEGTLAIMLGADDDAAAERAVPVVETMSRSIYRTGKLGTGHAMKALNNFVAGAAFTATAEALTAGARFGLDPQVMIDVLNDSTGQTFSSSVVFGPHIVEGRYATGFALPLLTKDVRIAQTLQQAVGHHAPVADAVSAALGEALEALGDVDHTEAFRYWEKQ